LKRKLPAQITAVPCTVNQDIKAVTPIKPLSDRYMQLIFWGNETEILARDVKQGTTVQSLVYENLFSRPFSLPPAAEQNRIIAKVDELMALCDQLQSRITTASQLQQKLADALVAQAVV
jgi:type I restriction enzyme S subunit